MEGRDAVLDLFRAFGGAFQIVDMSETRTVSSADQVFSFNDESFKVNSTGIFYRVPVVHHIRFSDGLITLLHNVHDTYAAEQAFRGQEAITLPIVNGTFVPGEDKFAGAAAETVARDLLQRIASGQSPADLLDNAIRVLAPGAATQVDFAGVWLGKAESLTFFERFSAALGGGALRVDELVSMGGTVAVSVTQDAGGTSVEWIALIQVTGSGLVGRVSIYLDTPSLART